MLKGIRNLVFGKPPPPTWDAAVPFIPPVEKCHVIKVYDGDTITVAAHLPFDKTLYRFSVRLNYIDCPEIKGKTEEEKRVAEKARDRIQELTLGKKVYLKNVQTEKYGRLLAEVYTVDGICLNDLLVEERLAVKYDGGTKVSPVSWSKYQMTGSLD